jgi:hypothetical protein
MIPPDAQIAIISTAANKAVQKRTEVAQSVEYTAETEETNTNEEARNVDSAAEKNATAATHAAEEAAGEAVHKAEKRTKVAKAIKNAAKTGEIYTTEEAQTVDSTVEKDAMAATHAAEDDSGKATQAVEKEWINPVSASGRKPTKKQRREAIKDEVQKKQEECETVFCRCCDKCDISFPLDYPLMVPSTGSFAMRLLGQTPQSLRKLEALTGYFGNHLQDLTKGDWEELCYWPTTWVEVLVVLLCHAFHCSRVQCLILEEPENQKKQEKEEKDTASSEHVFPLRPEIDTLLAIVYKGYHYAVVKVDLKTREVVIWDAARDMSYKIVEHWRNLVVHVLRMHQPDKVQEDAANIVYVAAKKPPQLKDGMPLWTLQGMEGGYVQKDNYSCGPIAINRFAAMLKSFSDGMVDDAVDACVESPEELEDRNVANAKNLFEILLERKQDVFKDMEHGKEEEKKQPAMGTPKRDRDNDDDDLIDTPDDTGVQHAARKKRLKRIQGETAKGEASKVDITLVDEEDSRLAAEESGDGGESKGRWTKEEEEKMEYGIKRSLLKQYGVEKKHVENMYRVKDAHPGLDGAFDFLRNNGATVEDVAEAIRGVPMWGQQPMSHSDILHHPKKIPRDCGYKDLEQEGPTLNKEL